MQIILLHPRFTQAKSVTLTHRHLAWLVLAMLTLVMAGAVMLHVLTTRFAVAIESPFLRGLLGPAAAVETGNKDQYLKQNLAVMATKLGEMQAQLVRLDALGERVQGLAGVKPEAFNFRERPGRGGAAPFLQSGPDAPDLSLTEF